MCDYIFCIYTYTYTYIIICWYNCTLVNVDKAIAPSSTNTYVRKGLPYIHTGIETYEKLNRWHEHKGLQHTAPLQRTAPHCNTLHRTATRCNTTATHSRGMSTWVCNTPHHCNHCFTLQRTATHCNTLQHTGTHWNTLEHTETNCQHTATHSHRGLEHKVAARRGGCDAVSITCRWLARDACKYVSRGMTSIRWVRHCVRMCVCVFVCVCVWVSVLQCVL